MLTPNVEVWEVHAYARTALMGCGWRADQWPYLKLGVWETFKALQRLRILQLGGYDV